MNNKFLEFTIPSLIYPGIMTAGIASHYTLLNMNAPLSVSTYIPVIVAAALIAILEYIYPHAQTWMPRQEDIKTDALFMAVVQLALPKAVMICLLLAVIQPFHNLGLNIDGLWPHNLPVWLQAVLVILISDFLRYWLHRAAHTIPLLWRIHAVHHSPDRLYWLNVGRFHPLEKSLQMCLDTLPFLLLGVDESVIALHFLLYSINGFFQHCNIRLNYGPLNYLISSAELHRWHHSRIPEESNNNYGNNIIIWDWLFGTRFLPRDRNITTLGVRNEHYPQDFSSLLHAPFTADIVSFPVPLLSWKQITEQLLLAMHMLICKIRCWIPLKDATRTPLAVQQQVLRRILSENGNTHFGREHHFENIQSYADFKHLVPVKSFESLSPYIDAQLKTGEPALTSERPFMYALTSGTTGIPKYIPVLESTLRLNKKAQRIFSYLQYRACSQAFSGRMLGIVSPAIEGTLDTGIPYGSASGQLYMAMPKILRSKYLIPSEVFKIQDHALKYHTILRLALAERSITYLGGANPSSFLRLLEILNDAKDEFIESLESGIYSHMNKLPPHIQNTVAPLIKADSMRADELRSLGSQALSYANVWPSIRLVATWTGGSCGIALCALQQRLPANIKIMDLGYLSSEVRGTITLNCTSNGGIPTLTDNFFEFVELSKWDKGEPDYLTLDQLEPRQYYYVIVTTSAGLYRYFINDIVEVTGFLEKTPLLRFVQKGQGVTNITGEKLYEAQVITAVAETLSAEGIMFNNYLMAADEVESRYRLLIEASDEQPLQLDSIANRLDTLLSDLNIEYKVKLASGRLRPLVIHLLPPGTGEILKATRLRAGQREGQFKPRILQYLREIPSSLSQYISPSQQHSGN